MKLSHSLFAASVCLALTTAVGCGDGSSSTAGTGGSTTDNGKAVSELTLSPTGVTLAKGTTKQYTATAKYADGTTKDVTEDAATVWNTSNTAAATVSKTGLVTAVDVNANVTITVEYKGQRASDNLVITP